MRILVSTLNNIIKANTDDDDSTFSVKQIHCIKFTVKLIVSIGIIPCLEEGVGMDMAKLCPEAITIPREDLSCTEVRLSLSLE